MESKAKVHCIMTNTMRDLINKANDAELTKDNIIQMYQYDRVFYLLYYK